MRVYFFLSECLSVCLFVCLELFKKTYKRNAMKFGRLVYNQKLKTMFEEWMLPAILKTVDPEETKFGLYKLLPKNAYFL